MITTDQNNHKELGVLKMKKVRHYLAGSIFAALGIIFLYLDVTPRVDQMDHGMQMDHNPSRHDIELLGIGEMTWMWFTMALVHFFIRDCNCSKCKG